MHWSGDTVLRLAAALLVVGVPPWGQISALPPPSPRHHLPLQHEQPQPQPETLDQQFARLGLRPPRPYYTPPYAFVDWGAWREGGSEDFVALDITPIPAPGPTTATLPQAQGALALAQPSFVRVITDQPVGQGEGRIDGASSSHLYISSFTGNPLGRDQMYLVAGLDAFAGADVPQPVAPPMQVVGGSVVWPNEVTDVPPALFAGKRGVVVAGGFLVPGKNNGGIWFSERKDGVAEPWVQLLATKDHFYHRTLFYDVDKDGRLDMLTCRATKPLFGAGHGELVWLEPASRADPTGPWVEHVLGPHCDTFFTVRDLNHDGRDEIVVAEFWASALSIIQTKHPRGSFANPADLSRLVIDDAVGHVFDVQVTDMNNDGYDDLLITTHQGAKDTPTGAVYVYEIPTNLVLDASVQWKRHVLAYDFPVLNFGMGEAAPGGAQAFHPSNRAHQGKPAIVLAGDAARQAYLLTPRSEELDDWSYYLTILHTCGCTVGGIGIGDVDDDGWAELFIPCYEKGYVAVYSYGAVSQAGAREAPSPMLPAQSTEIEEMVEGEKEVKADGDYGAAMEGEAMFEGMEGP